MKIRYSGDDRVELHTVTDVAEAVGRHPSITWQDIFRFRKAPEPSVVYGRRKYYDTDQFLAVVQLLKLAAKK